jgi:rubrerythrin
MAQIQTRDDLVYALTLAAELEHSLSIQYLYAAYTLKKDPSSDDITWPQATMVQEWAAVLLEISRQEMEHLGFANNLLTTIGGAPHFRRPNFPQPAGAYGIQLPAELEPLSPNALERFIEYEKPDDEAWQSPPTAPPPGVPVDLDYHSIHDLYKQIRHAFETMSEEALFIGPPEAQVDNESIFLEKVERGYDVKLFKVVDRETALAAIDQIIEEGEGGGPRTAEEEAESHCEKLKLILKQYLAELKTDPDFNPARSVIRNPVTRKGHRDADSGTMITDPLSRRVADLFNTSYEALLFSLIRFYARTDETEEELYGLQHTAFFPLMVMILRPLAEVVSTMPAFEPETAERAGPPFEFYRSIQFLPQKASAWTMILERLWEMANEAQAICEVDGAPERMGFIAENLKRIAVNFEGYMSVERPLPLDG